MDRTGPNGHVWDQNKAEDNLRNHGVSFEEAEVAIEDRNHQMFTDELHSEGEQRLTIIGLSDRKLLRVTVKSFNETENLYRIISAREAEGEHQRLYYGDAVSDGVRAQACLPITKSNKRLHGAKIDKEKRERKRNKE